jgi:hypothetical protein
MDRSTTGGRVMKPRKSAFILQSLTLLLLVAISQPVQSQNENRPEIYSGGGASFAVYHLPDVFPGYAFGAGLSLPLSQSLSLVLNFGYDCLQNGPIPAQRVWRAGILRTFSLHFKFPIVHLGENIAAYVSIGAGMVRTNVLYPYRDNFTHPALFIGTGFEMRTKTIVTPFVEGTLSVFTRLHTEYLSAGVAVYAFIPVKAGVRIRL